MGNEGEHLPVNPSSLEVEENKWLDIKVLYAAFAVAKA
jgi:hypothetical protein